MRSLIVVHGDPHVDEGVHGKQRRLGVSLEKIGGDGDGPIESDKPELRLIVSIVCLHWKATT